MKEQAHADTRNAHTKSQRKILSQVAIFLESDGSRPQIALFTVLTVPDLILLLTYLHRHARTLSDPISDHLAQALPHTERGGVVGAQRRFSLSDRSRT